jgi:hypothetical protein
MAAVAVAGLVTYLALLALVVLVEEVLAGKVLRVRDGMVLLALQIQVVVAVVVAVKQV